MMIEGGGGEFFLLSLEISSTKNDGKINRRWNSIVSIQRELDRRTGS